MIQSNAVTVPSAAPWRGIPPARPAMARQRGSSVAGVAGWWIALWGVGCAASFVIGFHAALAALMVLCLAGALFGLHRHFVGALAVAGLCTLDAMSRVFLLSGGLLRWNTFNYLLLGAAILAAPLLFGLRSAQLRLLQVLTVVLVAGLLLSADLTRGSHDVLGFLAVFGLFVYFARLGPSREAWYWLAVATSAFGALIGLALILQLGKLPYIDPNAWAAGPLTGLVAAALAFPMAGGRRRGQLVLAVGALFNAGWVFLSASRGAMLAAACCLLLLLVTARSARQRLVMITAGVLVSAAVLSSFGNLRDYAIHRVEKLVDPESSWEGRTSRRSSLVLGGLEVFNRNSWIGVGTGGFVPAWNAARGSKEMADYDAASGKIAHSAWVKVLVENGIPGIVLLAAFVLSFAVVGLQSPDPSLRAIGVFTTITLTFILMTTEFQSKAQWFLAAGSLALLHRRHVAHYLWWRRKKAWRRPFGVS